MTSAGRRTGQPADVPRLAARGRSAGMYQIPGVPVPVAPPPLFRSWSDYLAKTSYAERMGRCHAAAKKANRKRLLSPMPTERITGADVWAIIERAGGRCIHCGSLAVEKRPSDPRTGAPVAWAQVGRRIGSLEHLTGRFKGGDNHLWNLAWACLWCNTWPGERHPGATDHGGFHPTI